MSRPMRTQGTNRETCVAASRIGQRGRRWDRMAAALLVLVFTGCAVGPDYVAPEISAPQAWHAELRYGATADQADPPALASWWTTLDDPILTSLIDRAVQGNLDLKKAQARVREARARRGISQSDLFPTLNATVSATYSRGSGSAGTAQGSFEGTAQYSYAIGLDASWEVDVFGGVRRSVEAATADLQASGEDLRSALVSLLGEVALNYIEARTFQARLAVAEANLSAQTETHELTAVRVQAGLTTALDLEQATYNLENTRSQIPTLQSGLEEPRTVWRPPRRAAGGGPCRTGGAAADPGGPARIRRRHPGGPPPPAAGSSGRPTHARRGDRPGRRGHGGAAPEIHAPWIDRVSTPWT